MMVYAITGTNPQIADLRISSFVSADLARETDISLTNKLADSELADKTTR